MSANEYKKQYLNHSHQVKLCNDIFNGIDTAKQYLLKYEEESEANFKKRQDVAVLNNFVFRTIDTMQNIVFRKDIDITNVTNARMLVYLEKIDLSNNIDHFAKKLFINARVDGYTFILAESQRYDVAEIKTKQIADAAGIRPYLMNIKREDVINWQGADINFSDWIIIRETVMIEKPDYEEEEVIQFRVIYADGTIFILNEKNELKETYNVKPIGYPILIKVGKRDVPEFYDQAKHNVLHMNANSERRSYVRIGANPFFAFGAENYDSSKAPSTLSISEGFQFDTHNWKANWIEMTGANDEIIGNNAKDYELAMMQQSVEFLTADSNLTATQVNKESTPKESKLKHFAREIEDALNVALIRLGLSIDGGLGVNIIVVNKDFDNSLLDFQEAESYRQDYLQGIISLETLWNIYERGERLMPKNEKERDTEKALLKDIVAD